jgi:hypothetical protein
MVLVSGPELIEDVKRAPDDVLSGIKAELEVRSRAKRSSHSHKDYLVSSSRIHARHIGPERRIPH